MEFNERNVAALRAYDGLEGKETTIDITPAPGAIHALILRVASCGPADLVAALRMAAEAGSEAPTYAEIVAAIDGERQ